jgi:hypothetical protein
MLQLLFMTPDVTVMMVVAWMMLVVVTEVFCVASSSDIFKSSRIPAASPL